MPSTTQFYNDPKGDIPPLIWGILAVMALVLDAQEAEASRYYVTPETIQQDQESREYNRNANETVKTIVNPQNIVKKIVGQQVRDGIKKDVGGNSDKKVPNPYGSKGKPDHQEKVRELTKKAQSEAKEGETVLSEKKIQGHDSNRKPDAQIVGEEGKTRKVSEAERRPESQRNQTREAEYRKLEVEQETHKVGDTN